VRSDDHASSSIAFKDEFERIESILDEDMKLFLKLFEVSTYEGSRSAALEMKKIAKRMTKDYKKFLLFHSFYFLIRSDKKMLSWPNSPLLVLLQFFDPNVLFGDDAVPLQEAVMRFTLLRY
jgi:hypothetical protein